MTRMTWILKTLDTYTSPPTFCSPQSQLVISSMQIHVPSMKRANIAFWLLCFVVARDVLLLQVTPRQWQKEEFFQRSSICRFRTQTQMPMPVALQRSTSPIGTNAPHLANNRLPNWAALLSQRIAARKGASIRHHLAKHSYGKRRRAAERFAGWFATILILSVHYSLLH